MKIYDFAQLIRLNFWISFLVDQLLQEGGFSAIFRDNKVGLGAQNLRFLDTCSYMHKNYDFEKFSYNSGKTCVHIIFYSMKFFELVNERKLLRFIENSPNVVHNKNYLIRNLQCNAYSGFFFLCQVTSAHHLGKLQSLEKESFWEKNRAHFKTLLNCTESLNEYCKSNSLGKFSLWMARPGKNGLISNKQFYYSIWWFRNWERKFPQVILTCK